MKDLVAILLAFGGVFLFALALFALISAIVAVPAYFLLNWTFALFALPYQVTFLQVFVAVMLLKWIYGWMTSKAETSKE